MKSYAAVLGICALVFSCTDMPKPASVPEPDISETPFVRSAPVIFTEIVPQNLDYEDENGEHSDWIELFNPADTAVNLAGYSLSKSASESKWTFGNVIVPPQSFLVVFFSKKDRADYEAASDSTSMIGGGAWGWSDAQSTPVSGTSSAKPWKFSRYVSTENGARVISGQMQLGTNEELGWSSACIFVGVGTGSKNDTHDLGSANQLLLTGYVTKDEPLEIRLTQPDVDDWKGFSMTLTGTGDSTTTYSLNIPSGKTFPDLEHIYGIRFSAVSNHYSPVQFTFRSIVARNQGHFSHTSFKLPKSGGEIFLFDAAGTLRDSIAYPKVPTGMSYALTSGGWGFARPSPLGIENFAYAGQATDKFELPPSGFYSEPFSVSLSGSSEGTARCEVGGKAPTEQSPVCPEVLAISSTTVLRVATFRDGMLPSETTTRTYVFEEQPGIATAFITADPDQLFSPDSGIYEEGPNANAAEPHYGANYWLDKTIPAEIAFFEPGSSVPAFESPAGYEIFGNYSRSNDKKSFALKFRKKYGNSKLDYRIFPDYPNLESFKDIVFRNNGGNFYQDYIRDRLGSSITKGLGVDYQKGRFAIVFYNGEYFGIHSIRERSNENYFETNYGFDANSIDLLKSDNSASAGSSADFDALESYVQGNDLAVSDNYKYVASQMDIDNFISYMQTEMFVANQDWPGNNLKKWRSTSPLTKWKWFLYDLDWGFANGHTQYSDIDMFHFVTDSLASGYPNGAEYTVLFRNLLKNPGFKNRFINRFAALVKTKFSADSVLEKIDAMMREIDAEIPRDQDRWNHNAGYMENSLSTIREFAMKRPAKVISEMKEFFGLGEIQEVSVAASGCGTISVDGIRVRSAMVPLFAEIPVTIRAENGAGCTFSSWSDGNVSAERVVIPQQGNSYIAVFR